MARARTRASTDIWPGFVDALAALLVVIIFLLVVFVLAQVFLAQALSGRDEALQRLATQVNELGELLSLERESNANLRLNVAQLSASLQQANSERDALVLRLGEARDQAQELAAQVGNLRARTEDAETSLAESQAFLTADRESIRVQLAQIERLQRDLAALAQVRNEMEMRISRLAAVLEESEQEAATLTARAVDLDTALEESRTDAEMLRGERANLAADLEASHLEADGLRTQIADLRIALAASRDENTELLARAAQLRADLEESEGAAKDLTATLTQAQTDRDALAASLEETAADRETLVAALEESQLVTAELREEIAVLTAEAEDFQSLAGTLREHSTELDATLAQVRDVAGNLRDRAAELEARLATEEERTLLAQKTIEEREIRLADVQRLYAARNADLEDARGLSTAANAQVAILNEQVMALRQQLLSLQQAIEAAEVKDREQNVVISNLGERLNRALAAKVEELSRFRSEFFGRLREVLGERRDITIVGDRFVFRSEVLFRSGEADLRDEGKARLAALANTLLEITPTIPQDIPWILRVDGHTDAIPIATPQFPSNWELSASRAISVIQFLIERGVPANRLAATGFGEFQPLDPGHDEIANRRNRRIELKLTER
jgi:chemotaxis protein MotB